MLGESSRLSLMLSGSLTNAAFGEESKGGNGSPSFEVTHNMPSGSIALLAVQPGGSAGGVTPSKFSLNTVVGLRHRGSRTHASSASTVDEVTPATPPAANTLAAIEVPDTNERNSFILGASDQLSSAGSYTYPVLVRSGTRFLALRPKAFAAGTELLLPANAALVEAEASWVGAPAMGPNGFPPPKIQSLLRATALPGTLFWTPGMLVFCVQVLAAVS
jgi:hypothetical protein